MTAISIGGRLVGAGQPCFVIAEAGVNHNGSLELALALVDAAAAAGADAVKFQSFTADGVASPDAPKAGYQLETTSPEESQRGMLRALELSPEAHRAIVARCVERGIAFLSTPFDLPSVELLRELAVPALKVASPDVTNHLLLRAIGAAGLPALLSTGMSTLDEVVAATGVLRDAGCSALAVLHCVSAYPAPASDANLRVLPVLAERLGVPVGYSDHTVGDEVALAAVALGASLLERHLTLDRALPGPDHAASQEPEELAALIRRVRSVEAALGDGVKRAMPSELGNLVTVRRSLAAAHDLEPGRVIAGGDLTALRPATGIEPSRAQEVVGRSLRRAIRRGDLLAWDDLA